MHQVASKSAGRCGRPRTAACAALAVLLLAASAMSAAVAQAASGAELLARMQQAAQSLNYAGTFIYQHGSHLVASYIVHQGANPASGQGGRERIEVLDGPKHREFLREDKVVYSLLPEVPLVLVEFRETDHFPGLITGDPAQLLQWYRVHLLDEPGRVAGRPCTQAELRPNDTWRWGYRVCLDDQYGLLLKVQTLDQNGDTLEQAAFSEVAVGPSTDLSQLASRHDWQQWQQVQGGQKSRLASSGWAIAAPPGFASVSELKRKLKGRAQVHQMVLSDGLAAISVFIEPYDPALGLAESIGGYGATSIYRGRKDDHWVTVLGEVPPQTVRAVADTIQH